MGSRAVAHRGADRGIGNSDGENPINLLARQQRHHLTEKKKKGDRWTIFRIQECDER